MSELTLWLVVASLTSLHLVASAFGKVFWVPSSAPAVPAMRWHGASGDDLMLDDSMVPADIEANTKPGSTAGMFVGPSQRTSPARRVSLD